MTSYKVEKIIKILYSRLMTTNIKWALVGSTNMQLQGMQIEPRDIDIVIQHKNLKEISNIFREYSATKVKQLKTLSNTPAWEVKAIINNTEIQFFGGDEIDVYVSKLLANKIILMQVNNIDIPCFTLIAESQAYIETNRKYKAELIQKFLNTR